ncbi:MarR family transcriptional regulator [Rhizobium sp. SSA_523]|uniref:MarR family winged helix-turn-helix transcriptional regulator n=1 Tax=Rhizobium sp. SSA_523 TaxID=2952477 RepID=UPI002091A6AA|nr:MarR family transcriptional regulator [Rhizobium sp. SSA_523]MCO5731483.1 MarR family transcriptional regulator [Rhizobium sp. SSA_523]WKC21998.1 MarR family transcriptional regulator [Rhizobium sp. SSA_523]
MYVVDMETPKNPTSLNHRIREGLARLAVAMRSDDWSRAKGAGVNPAQLSILEALEGGPEGMSVKAIAAYLAVSQPSATDSLNALERKGLIEKRAGSDKRAVTVFLTDAGRALLAAPDQADARAARQAVDCLAQDEQEALLISIVKIIRRLQDIDAIPIQRMCATCRYFAPFAHQDAERPHHCHFVDAAFGQRDIRIECRDHDTADPASRAATWEVFAKG